MTVYSDDPVAVARDFKAKGAAQMHTVDLEGARDGGTPNLGIIERITAETGLFVECGGGLRDMEAIDRAFAAGVGRVILGTAAVSDERLLAGAVQKYGEKIAVGADLRDAGSPSGAGARTPPHGGGLSTAHRGPGRADGHLHGYFPGRGHARRERGAV